MRSANIFITPLSSYNTQKRYPISHPLGWGKGCVCCEFKIWSLFYTIYYILSWWRHQMEPFPRYWPFVWGIHRWPVTLMFSLICAWINGWVNNREAGDLRRHRAHYDVIVMFYTAIIMITYYVYRDTTHGGIRRFDSCRPRCRRRGVRLSVITILARLSIQRNCAILLLCQGHVPPTAICQGHVPSHYYVKAMCHPTTMSRPCAIPLLCQGHVPPTAMSRPCAIPLLCQGHVPSRYYVKAMCHPLLCQGHVPPHYYVKAMCHPLLCQGHVSSRYYVKAMCHPATMSRPCGTRLSVITILARLSIQLNCAIPLLCQGHVPPTAICQGHVSSRYYVKAMCHPTTTCMSRPCAIPLLCQGHVPPTAMSRPCAIPLLCQGHVPSFYNVKAIRHLPKRLSIAQCMHEWWSLKNNRCCQIKKMFIVLIFYTCVRRWYVWLHLHATLASIFFNSSVIFLITSPYNILTILVWRIDVQHWFMSNFYHLIELIAADVATVLKEWFSLYRIISSCDIVPR